ncbi:MAG: S-layer homology domain-containing protein [Bacillota bacterium]|nr:S-layer homology domain-containing protein [Bacillota bacterium]
MKRFILITLTICMVLSCFIFTFADDTHVTRAQLAKMLVDSSKFSDEAKSNLSFNVFSDVSRTSENAQNIYIASREGWMLGYTDGSFRPNNNLKLEEVCCAVIKCLGYNSKELKGAFPDAYIEKATSLSLLKGVETEKGKLISLADCELILHNAGLGDFKTEGVYFGVVTSSSKKTLNDDTANMEYSVSVTCTDGNTRTFTSQSYSSFSIGTIVKVDVNSVKTSISKVSEKSLSGRISTNLNSVGDLKLSSDLEVIEVDDYGNAAKVDIELLAGVTLKSSDVKYYTLDSAGAVNAIILDDFTGNLWHYSICTQAESSRTEQSLSSRYTFIENGKTQTKQYSNKAYTIEEGVVAIKQSSDGEIAKMSNLDAVRVETLNSNKLSNGSTTYKVADDVQVYVKNGSEYMQTTISALENSTYSTYKAYCDKQGLKLVRIVIAY